MMAGAGSAASGWRMAAVKQVSGEHCKQRSQSIFHYCREGFRGSRKSFSAHATDIVLVSFAEEGWKTDVFPLDLSAALPV
jgi:hypothetical protein